MPSYGGPQLALPRLTQVVKKLIIGLFVAYVAQLILDKWLNFNVAGLLALSPGGPGLWQLVTYVLVDLSDPVMFFVGLLFLWWALSPFEVGYGPQRTLQLCLVTALSASLPAYALGLVVHGSPPLYGSSSLWFGGIAATTWLFGDRPMSLFGLFTMSAKQFLWLLLGMSVLMFIASKDHTRLVADLGAIGGGVGFVRWIKRPRTPNAPRKSAPRPPGIKVIQGGLDDNGRPKWLN